MLAHATQRLLGKLVRSILHCTLSTITGNASGESESRDCSLGTWRYTGSTRAHLGTACTPVEQATLRHERAVRRQAAPGAATRCPVRGNHGRGGGARRGGGAKACAGRACGSLAASRPHAAGGAAACGRALAGRLRAADAHGRSTVSWKKAGQTSAWRCRRRSEDGTGTSDALMPDLCRADTLEKEPALCSAQAKRHPDASQVVCRSSAMRFSFIPTMHSWPARDPLAHTFQPMRKALSIKDTEKSHLIRRKST